MQAKDIPKEPILVFLEGLPEGVWATWGDGYSMPTVQDAMPPGTPPKVQRAKMAALIKMKLVEGCPCGCRGDFRIVKKELDKK